MNTAFRLLSKRKVPDAGGTYGVDFPRIADDYAWNAGTALSYTADWVIEMDMELKTPMPTSIQGLLGSTTSFMHYINNTGRLLFISGGAVRGTSTDPLPMGVKFKLKMEKLALSYFISIDGTPVDTFTLPAGTQFQFKYAGKIPTQVNPLFGKIYTLKFGTPAAPNEHDYLNTIGSGLWNDNGTVGGFPLTLVGNATYFLIP